ncbi:noncanonical pyrimidine nucleotidase, YjjG family [Pasteurellaceae bacterium RH1A]|nr:noncanonical pyrimidine nucleotidase, YjjG family [Pasteurellaceae bacterium RH1A]
MKYDWILFDADETLYSYNSFIGLKSMLARYGLDFTPQDYEAFQAVNKPLWVAYQNKEIEAADIQRIRFEKLAQETGQDVFKLNQELMAEMATVSLPLDGTMEALDALHGRVKMGIITNGFTALQEARLNNTQTTKYFDLLVVSEQVGVAKPDRRVFEHAFEQMGDFELSKVLMVGDTLASDILGANGVGIDSCWLNAHGQANDTEIVPTYEITNLRELISLVNKESM